MYASVDQPIRSLIVTSPTPAEGKTTVASNLGVVFSKSGKRVTIVDADLHRPRVHSVFNTKFNPGLSSMFLDRTVQLNGTFQETTVDSLYVVSAGKLPPNPSELLGSNKMLEIIQLILEKSDIVIIDTPPILTVTDAMGLAPSVDGVLLVVKPGFRELHPGHLAAFIVAFAGATSMIVLRMIGQTERRVSLIGVVMVSALVVSGILMIPVFVWPSTDAILKLGLIGLLGGTAQMTMMAATRMAPANRVAPAQYSQVIWAVVFSVLFFAEVPDWIALVGIGMIGLSGLFTLLREDKVSGWPRRVPLLRNRL
jgi:capsular exopolysaccharide synthesis family protein